AGTDRLRTAVSSPDICRITKRTGVHSSGTRPVGVRARGGRAVVDAGRFAYRAGPVTVHAGRRCVWVTGKVSKSAVSSGRILC
ncbi:hypothetical protein ACGFYH_35860, partial [Streptomyces sp. NPDC048392]